MVIIGCISQILFTAIETIIERNLTLLLPQLALSKFFRERNISKKIRPIKDKTVFSFKGFNLIKCYFSVKYSACAFYQLFQC